MKKLKNNNNKEWIINVSKFFLTNKRTTKIASSSPNHKDFKVSRRRRFKTDATVLC